ncbi:unnamed protein product [Protopolystoma xenopodis]|uniref:Syntrophin C-terminal PH domain-containing protein n=1 Tax=Protopolystoma xenopodis TaxID=117903 RepID=A0A3S4ZTM1_9PLAT|nr:unnamed protein product [Protopolystoma xenopodis]
MTLRIRGGKNGIETHTFAVSTADDLATWARAIVEGGHSAVTAAREIVVACRWRGQDCRLIMHYETGISLTLKQSRPLQASRTAFTTGSGDEMKGQTNQSSALISNQMAKDAGLDQDLVVLWQFPYQRLCSTADDGQSLLWIDFGQEGERVDPFKRLLDLFTKST